MRHRMAQWAWIVLVIVGTGAVPALAADGESEARQYYESAVADVGQYVKDGNVTGESFCWHAGFSMGGFLQAYQAFGDLAWLDYAVKYYDSLVDAMATGPGGYKGWIGPFIYDKRVWCDVHVGDSVLADGLLEFAELVLADPALKARYGAKADTYVAIAAKHVIDKWDARGTWREDGRFGAYISWNQYGEPGNFTQWSPRPEIRKSSLSLPFNKQNHMGVVCLRLYRITGETKYRDRAEKIFSFMRSRFQFFDDHYVWNYWEPFGPWDVAESKRDTVHWMGVHPYRNYQAGEIHQIVQAYHTGVVFSRTDIERIINTNLKVMWNQDKAKAEFRNSNVTIPGYKKPAASERYPGSAGTLWTALADFDQAVRDLQAAQLKEGRGIRHDIAVAYFKNVVCATPPSFKRKYAAEPKTLPEFPVSESPELLVVNVLPSVIHRGRDAFWVCKAYIGGTVKVALYSADGQTIKATLYEGPIRNPLIGTFNGLDPDGVETFAGDYRVRWTFGTGYREYPIRIID